MANSIAEAETFLTDGANGLQIDIQFSPSGISKTTQHGLPCFCSRNCMKSENVKDYLEFLRRTTTLGAKNYNPQLSLIFINLRLDALSRAVLYSAGEKFADEIINYLYAKGKVSSRAWIILGLPDVRSLAFVRGFREAFQSANMKWHLERIGYSVQKFSRSDKLKSALLSAGISNHIWVGAGSSNCKRIGTPQRVIRLASEREIIRKLGNSFVDKVYTWTVDLPNNMRESLRLGIDAVITNKPNQLKIVLKEAEFEPYLRLADVSDVPWRWNTRSINKKSDTDNKRLMLDEIDKELDALNRPV
uniref:GP-PDE domain-containing protein n=1 Tax=Strigamia maritima TaxID=126957 RepID=T1J513_STRMM